MCGALVLAAGSGALQLLDARLDAQVTTALIERLAVAELVVSRGDPAALGEVAPGGGVLPVAEQLTQVKDPTGRLLFTVPEGATALLDPSRAAAAAAGVFQLQVQGPGPQPTALVAGPVTTAAGQPVVVVVGASLVLSRQAVHEARVLLPAAVPAALVGGAGAWLLAGAALLPVERVRRQAERVRVHDDDVGLWIPRTGDEVERLTRTLDALVRQLHEALRHRQDQLAESAHELRTPLGALTAELELLERERGAGEAHAPGLVAVHALAGAPDGARRAAAAAGGGRPGGGPPAPGGQRADVPGGGRGGAVRPPARRGRPASSWWRWAVGQPCRRWCAPAPASARSWTTSWSTPWRWCPRGPGRGERAGGGARRAAAGRRRRLRRRPAGGGVHPLPPGWRDPSSG